MFNSRSTHRVFAWSLGCAVRRRNSSKKKKIQFLLIMKEGGLEMILDGFEMEPILLSSYKVNSVAF